MDKELRTKMLKSLPKGEQLTLIKSGLTCIKIEDDYGFMRVMSPKGMMLTDYGNVTHPSVQVAEKLMPSIFDNDSWSILKKEDSMGQIIDTINKIK